MLLLIISFIGLSQAATGWRLVKDKDDIRVYSQQKPDYSLKHFKAETHINYRPDTVLAALQDTQACTQWVHNCISNQMVEMIDVRTRIYHTTIKAPLWLKDRDFYQQSHVVYSPGEQLFTISFQSRPDYAPVNDKTVRIHDIEMKWTLKALDIDKTEVTYEVYIDPKLPFKSINHAMIKKSVFKTLQGLAEIVQKPKYGETTYSEAELELLTGEVGL